MLFLKEYQALENAIAKAISIICQSPDQDIPDRQLCVRLRSIRVTVIRRRDKAAKLEKPKSPRRKS